MKDPQDTIVITVELRHRDHWGAEEQRTQQSFYKYLWPPEEGRIRMSETHFYELMGDTLESKARKTIDDLLEWRRENHKH